MGTDIHLYVERRRGSAWEAIGKWVRNDFYDPDEPGDPELVFESPVLVHRNYALFAVLANVRNENEPGCLGCLLGLFGFSRKPSGIGYVPISDPKGLPDDLSPDLVKETASDNQMEFHSHSWLTLREILDYDWDQPVNIRRIILDVQPEACQDEKANPPMLVQREGTHGTGPVNIATTARQDAREFLEEVVPRL